jgi:hypothetical protein
MMALIMVRTQIQSMRRFGAQQAIVFLIGISPNRALKHCRAEN